MKFKKYLLLVWSTLFFTTCFANTISFDELEQRCYKDSRIFYKAYIEGSHYKHSYYLAATYFRKASNYLSEKNKSSALNALIQVRDALYGYGYKFSDDIDYVNWGLDEVYDISQLLDTL